MSKPALSFKHSNLFLRVVSSIVLIPIVLGAVWGGGVGYTALIVLISAIGLHEWLGLTAPNLHRICKIGTQACLFFIFVCLFFSGVVQALILSVPMFFLLVFLGNGSKTGCKPRRLTGKSFWVALGIPYLAWGGLAMIYLRTIPDTGPSLILYLLLVVWGTDIGAYFAGRLIGGPKLFPKISPKKTWAGLIGGMVFAAAIGYGVAVGFSESAPWLAAFVGAVMAVVAQAGDFFESFAKRQAGVKDSGCLIPGHGGILDRIDGLLFAAMFLALLVRLGM